MGTEKFCLKWNDFESNISSAFREIRSDGELFDVTLATEDEDHLKAHRVILAACSGFFRNILKRSGSHQNLLLYLKGVSSRDMTSVLNFMYHGEVSVAQDDLNNFLQVAEDLRVKGLTQNNSNSSGPSETKHPSSQSQRPKNPPARRPQPPAAVNSYQSYQEEDIQEVAQVPVKTETAADYGQEEMGGTMAQYGEEEAYLEGEYGDTGYGDYTMDQDQGLAGADGKKQCGECEAWFHPASLGRHIKEQHRTPLELLQCNTCGETFNTKSTLGNHLRRIHKIYKS